MLQAMISRFGGMPATILKLVFLGVINALTIFARQRSGQDTTG